MVLRSREETHPKNSWPKVTFCPRFAKNSYNRNILKFRGVGVVLGQENGPRELPTKSVSCNRILRESFVLVATRLQPWLTWQLHLCLRLEAGAATGGVAPINI